MQENQRDVGLVRAVGPWALAASIVSMIVGAGIFAVATSKAPLADAMVQIHPALRALMLAGTSLSMFGWIGSDILGSPRRQEIIGLATLIGLSVLVYLVQVRGALAIPK